VRASRRPDTINLAPAVFGSRPRTSRLSDGPLVVTDPATTTIIGPGAALLTVKGEGRSPVFDLRGGSLALSGLTIAGRVRNQGGRLRLAHGLIRHDSARVLGGGLFNEGSAALTDVAVTGNRARVGGGLANLGTMMLDHVKIRGNSASAASGLFSGRSAMLITLGAPAEAPRRGEVSQFQRSSSS
jgi:hypothetical protein